MEISNARWGTEPLTTSMPSFVFQASVSVHNPSFYAERFLSFITTSVFHKNNSKFIIGHFLTHYNAVNSCFDRVQNIILAIKTPQSRRRLRKSLGDDEIGFSARDVTPVAPAIGRRTYRDNLPNSEKEKKKVRGSI